MHFEGPVTGIDTACERVLRTLPQWFGIESSLLEYARNTRHLPTFIAQDEDTIVGFLSLQQHFPQAWEVNCIAVDLAYRGRGIGRQIHAYAEPWLVEQGAKVLQVKTLADSHPSAAYEETRRFYAALGYQPLEVFPALWGPQLPVLQMIKVLAAST
jgi:GNAT superfamily N-acetyltransferase